MNSGRVDFGISGTTIYPDRAVQVAFTRPYVDSGISILVRKDAGIKKLADLNNEKYTVANFANPQMEERAKRFFPKAKLIVFESAAAQLLAVRTGRAQALQMDTPITDYFATQDEGLVRGYCRATHRIAEQLDLPEAGRFHVVALARYDGR